MLGFVLPFNFRLAMETPMETRRKVRLENSAIILSVPEDVKIRARNVKVKSETTGTSFLFLLKEWVASSSLLPFPPSCVKHQKEWNLLQNL